MKISAYHKRKGDSVEFASINNYDKTYKAKVFTFTDDVPLGLGNYGEVVCGGTGYDQSVKLSEEIDMMCPDYSLYPQYTSAYGFLTRGCPNKCSWCIVPKKEGNITPYMKIDDFLDGRKEAILMDNNVLAHNHGLEQIARICDLKVKVDFNQGLDARLISDNEDIASLLGKVKWSSFLRMACDTKSQMEHIEKAVKRLNDNGVKPYKIFVYVLVKDIDDALERVMMLKKLKVNPFAQPYRDFTQGYEPPKQLKHFARWVNHKAIFKTVEWKDYSKNISKQ